MCEKEAKEKKRQTSLGESGTKCIAILFSSTNEQNIKSLSELSLSHTLELKSRRKRRKKGILHAIHSGRHRSRQ